MARTHALDLEGSTSWAATRFERVPWTMRFTWYRHLWGPLSGVRSAECGVRSAEVSI